MTSIISKFITKNLCDNNGSLDFESLNAIITKSFTLADSVLTSVLFDDAKFAIREGKQKVAGEAGLTADSVIVAKTSLRLCQSKSCSRCFGLHVCRFLVCGKCKFGNLCKNPHNVFSGNNLEVLKSHNLQDLTDRQLFKLLLQNDPYLLPEVCSHYNKGNGLHGSCRNNASCPKLHICQHFLLEDCAYGSSCKRAHHFNFNDKKPFQCFSQENVENLFQIYRNRFILTAPEERRGSEFPVAQAVGSATQRSLGGKPELPTGSKPLSDADRNEICLYFIRNTCSYKERCVHVHWHLPYRWQVLDCDGVTWSDLPLMEEIERAYCDPRHDKSSADEKSQATTFFSLYFLKSSKATDSQSSVDFMTMTYKSRPVRRLSTVSSILKPPHFILTTVWLWYWRDDVDQWLEFGKEGADTQASITSPTLEKLYWADSEMEVPFCAGGQHYTVHFRGDQGTRMYQQNVKYKTKREIRRRPRFVSAQEVESKLKSVSSHSTSSSTAESFPSHWDKVDPPDYEYKLLPLSKSVEYNMIETLFKNTMPNSTIHQIQRIQNPWLWKVFQWQKEQMMKKNEGKTVNQLHLFHGTDESLVQAISEQNFDWRICGAHGTAYGKGSYFAKDASYSDQYTRLNSRQRKVMFVALVLVGDFAQGRNHYVKPPPKGNGKAFYDSCVNSERNPSIYVIFEKQQIYPEYLIQYS